MITNLGNDYIVPTAGIIYIFNAKNCYTDPVNKQYFEYLRQTCTEVNVAGDSQIKSVIYAKVMDKDYLYYSPINSATLLKRSTAKYLNGF